MHSGLSAETLLQSYRIAHAVSLASLADCVDDAPLKENLRHACLRAFLHYLVAYDDRVMRLVGEEFAREQLASRDAARRRTKLVCELLIGFRDELDGIDQTSGSSTLGWWRGGMAPRRRCVDSRGWREDGSLSTIAEASLLLGWLSAAEPSNRSGGDKSSVATAPACSPVAPRCAESPASREPPACQRRLPRHGSNR